MGSDDAQLRATRVILVTDAITDEAATLIQAKLLFLDHADQEKAITLHLDSPGGTIEAARCLLETMDYVKPPVRTLCLRRAHGVAAVILAHGERGAREARARATVEFSPLWASGPADPAVLAELRAAESSLVDSLARDTGLPTNQVRGFFTEETAFDAETARFLNLIDRIVD